MRRNRKDCRVALTAHGLCELVDDFSSRHDIHTACTKYGLRGSVRECDDPRSRAGGRLFDARDVFVASVIAMLKGVSCPPALIRDSASKCYGWQPGDTRSWLCLEGRGARMSKRLTDAAGVGVDLQRQWNDVMQMIERHAELHEQAKAAATN